MNSVQEGRLDRSLGRWQLTLIGVSNAVGAGVLVLAGTMAANHAGPAAALSFAIAGLVCLLVALCYAELAAMMPEAGSAYSYTRLSMGRFASWLVGWCLILGYLVAGATVAVGWSGYFVTFIRRAGLDLPALYLQAPVEVSPDFVVTATGAYMNLPAMAVVLLCTYALSRGVRESARLNSLMVSLKLAAILLFIIIGLFFVDIGNWSPFVPATDDGRFGASGIFSAAVLAFFAYTGFEVVSASSQEARDSGRDIPFALIASFLICAILYICTTLVMTGIVPYPLLDHPSPITLAIEQAGPGLSWLGFVIGMLIVLGLPSAVLVSLYGQSRIFITMGDDRLIPSIFCRIHDRRRAPVEGTYIIGIVATLLAGVLPLEVLGELVSMGLLFCFMIVCLSVLLLRRRDPHRDRPFKVPFYPVAPILGALACLYLIFSLPPGTWLRLAVWLALGCVIYWLSGRRTPIPNAPT